MFFLLGNTGAILIAHNSFLLILPVLYWLEMTVVLKNTEEKWLTKMYGQEYLDYCMRVNRYIPWFAKKKCIKNAIVVVAVFATIPGLAACSLYSHENIEAGAFNRMTSYSGDYCIEINAKNPGHPEGESIFTTYYDWYNTSDYRTNVRIDFYFYINTLSADYEKLEDEVEIGGKTCYYIPENDTKVILLYEQDENAYLKIELNAMSHFDMSTGESADMNILLEDILESDDFKSAFTFTVFKLED